MKELSIEPGSARQVRRRSLYAPLLACVLALGIAAPDQARATAGSDVVGVVVALDQHVVAVTLHPVAGLFEHRGRPGRVANADTRAGAALAEQ